jgi:hypothetical protein
MALVLAPTGMAAADDSFSGRCRLEGTTYFSPPLTGTMRTMRFEFKGSGVCSGRLGGRSVSETPLTTRIAGPTEASCSRARSPSPAKGVATFTRGTAGRADDTTMPFSWTAGATGTDFEGTLRGKRAGSAYAYGTYVTPRTPGDPMARCENGGVSELQTDISVTTISPLIGRALGQRIDLSPAGGLRRVLEQGVRARCHAQAGTRCALTARVTGRTARKLGLRGGTVLGRTGAVIRRGRTTAGLRLRFSKRVRRALAKARSVTIVVRGSAGRSGVKQAVRLRR